MIFLRVLKICSLILIFSPKSSTEREPTKYLKVVPGFGNVEKFFQDIREINAKGERPSEDALDVRTKNLICGSVLKSSVFWRLRIEPADKKSLVYGDFIRTVNSSEEEPENEDDSVSKIQMAFRSEKRHIYLKSIDDQVEENSFRCLALHMGTEWNTQISLSEEYNLNRDKSEDDEYVPGRFVFIDDQNKEKVRPWYVAVEPATVLETRASKLEQLYLKSRPSERTDDADDDPVCKSSHAELIQICSSVLNSNGILRDNLVTSYDEDNIKCKRNQVSFNHQQVIIPYHEWMINCQTVMMNTEKHRFYVSYGTGPDNFFVYRTYITDYEEIDRPKFHIYNMSSNVVRYYIDY